MQAESPVQKGRKTLSRCLLTSSPRSLLRQLSACSTTVHSSTMHALSRCARVAAAAAQRCHAKASQACTPSVAGSNTHATAGGRKAQHFSGASPRAMAAEARYDSAAGHGCACTGCRRPWTAEKSCRARSWSACDLTAVIPAPRLPMQAALTHGAKVLVPGRQPHCAAAALACGEGVSFARGQWVGRVWLLNRAWQPAAFGPRPAHARWRQGRMRAQRAAVCATKSSPRLSSSSATASSGATCRTMAACEVP